MININSEAGMLSFAEAYAHELPNRILELVGDVGAGKTTFVRGLAKGLGVSEPVTSPSFTISKVYALEDGHRLVHYDFYRLPDPGLMRDELAETLNDPKNIVVVEWADSVQDLLPPSRQTIHFSYAENAENSNSFENLNPAGDSETSENPHNSDASKNFSNPDFSARTLDFIPPLNSKLPEQNS